MQYVFIETSDPLYWQERSLRYQVLRQPLSMPPGSEVFEFERESLHLVAVDTGAVVGCVLFHPDGSGGGRLYQMAVRFSLQRSGLGRAMVLHLENHLSLSGITHIVLHARMAVRGFYESLGYRAVGEEYTEVGIPHITMEKDLTSASDPSEY